jgi:hypothetical protein
MIKTNTNSPLKKFKLKNPFKKSMNFFREETSATTAVALDAKKECVNSISLLRSLVIDNGLMLKSIPPVRKESNMLEKPIGTSLYASSKSSAICRHNHTFNPCNLGPSSTINGAAGV